VTRKDIVNRIKEEFKERQKRKGNLLSSSELNKKDLQRTSEQLAELADVSSSTIKRMTVIKNNKVKSESLSELTLKPKTPFETAKKIAKEHGVTQSNKLLKMYLKPTLGKEV